MKIFLLIVSCFVIMPLTVFSCTCGEWPSFCEVSESNEIILEVTVLRKYGLLNKDRNFIDLLVTEVISDPKKEARRKYTMVDFPGLSCEYEIFQKFSLGERFVLALGKTRSEKGAIYTSFIPRICGTDILRIKKNRISGDILFDPYFRQEAYDYKWFKDHFNSICEKDHGNLSYVSIRPNPCVNYFRIENEDSHRISYIIYHANGQLISEGFVLSESVQEVSTIGLNQGIYFVRMSNQNAYKTEKIIKI